MTSPGTHDDPGWGGFVPNLIALVPGGLQYLQRRGPTGANPLVALRRIYLTFVYALVAIGVVVVILTWSDGVEGNVSPPLVLVLVLGFGLVPQLGLWRIERPLLCTDDAALAGTYRVRMFLRVAVSETAALIGFVGAVMVGAPWPYALGAFLAAPGLARAAPSRRSIEGDEERLRREGCGRSLVAALQRPTVTP